MKNNLISIVVPIYNVEKYIPECVDSIIAQTYENIEIILVNDGSTDNSGSVCEEYAKKDARIKVIHKKNGGLSDARNAGIKIAKGEYIGFVDSDDWIETDMYEKLIKACLENNADISICGLFRDYVDKSIKCPSPNNKVYSSENALKALIEGEELHDHAWSKLYKRSFFDDVEYPKGKLYEDVRTTYKLFLKSDVVVSIEDCLYHYRQRSGSIVRGSFNRNSLQLLDAINELAENPYINNYDCKKEFSHRLLKTKCYILRDMLLCGKECINTYDKEYRDFVKTLKSSRKLILSDSRFTKVYKLMAALSSFPRNVLQFVFSTKLMNKYIGSNYKYF